MLGQGCPMCCGKNKTTEQFIKETEEELKEAVRHLYEGYSVFIEIFLGDDGR